MPAAGQANQFPNMTAGVRVQHDSRMCSRNLNGPESTKAGKVCRRPQPHSEASVNAWVTAIIGLRSKKPKG